MSTEMDTITFVFFVSVIEWQLVSKYANIEV